MYIVTNVYVCDWLAGCGARMIPGQLHFTDLKKGKISDVHAGLQLSNYVQRSVEIISDNYKAPFPKEAAKYHV